MVENRIEAFLKSVDPDHFGNLAGDFFDSKSAETVASLKKILEHYRGSIGLDKLSLADARADAILVGEANAEPMEAEHALEMLVANNDWLCKRIKDGDPTCNCNTCYFCAYTVLRKVLEEWHDVFRGIDY